MSSLSGRILYDAWAPDGSHEVRLATPLEGAPGDALVLLARAKTSHALNVITSQSVTGWMSDDGTRVVLQASTNTTTWGGDWGGTAVEVTDLRLLELDPPSVTAPRVRSDITLPLLHVEGLAVAGALLRDSAPSGETRFWLHTGTSPATLVADLSSPPNTTQKISPSSWVLDPRSPNAHVTLLDLTLPPAEAARPLTHGGEFARPLGDWLVVYDLPGGDEGKAVFYAYDPRTTRYARFPVGHAPLGIVAGGAGVVGWTLSSSDAIWIAPTPEWR